MSTETYQPVRYGGKVFSSECTLGIVRPTLYPQVRYCGSSTYANALSALHLATEGAFYEVPIGAQAVSVVPNLKSIESFAAPKKGGIFDNRKVRELDRSIVNHELPNTAFSLQPVRTEEGPLNIERSGGGYKVSLVFEQSEEHSESVRRVTELLADFILKRCAKSLKEDDVFALSLADVRPRMDIGFIDPGKLPNELYEVIKYEPYSFYREASYYYKDRSTEEIFRANNDFMALDFEAADVWFGALKLTTISRNTKKPQV